MPYAISATNSMGAVGFQCDTLEEAQQKAVELENDGFQNVSIKDAQGNNALDTDEERDFNERN